MRLDAYDIGFITGAITVAVLWLILEVLVPILREKTKDEEDPPKEG